MKISYFSEPSNADEIFAVGNEYSVLKYYTSKWYRKDVISFMLNAGSERNPTFV